MEELPGLTDTFSTILADPPWRFANRTGKMAPEHKRLHRYRPLTIGEIKSLPVAAHAKPKPPLFMGAECTLRLGPRSYGGMGLRVQNEHRLVQGA